MEESKQNVCYHLCELLKSTREYEDVSYLDYEKQENNEEYVTVAFRNGYKIKVNVTADSGIALVRDVLKRIN